MMRRQLHLAFLCAFIVSALPLGHSATEFTPTKEGALLQIQPTTTIDEECVAFAFAPDGRLAYAVKRVINVRRYDMQRDDIWVLFTDGKRKRILDGSKAVQSPVPFSYAIQSLTWSPDGLRLSVDMLTSALIDAR
ncbi:MAG TPA: hypothetical protein VGA40_00680, partial [Candidatus Acidoferrales bacterium]